MGRGLVAGAFLLLAAAGAGAQTVRRQAADFSGVEQFWRLVDILRVQGEPTRAAWDQLFATPGYAALESRERRRAAIQLGMRAAFLPSNRRLRDSLIAVNGWTARVIRHLETLPARRAQLVAFAERMRKDDVVAQAAARAQSLLPPGTVSRYGHPAVAFLFFLPDGRGYPGLIVADLANVMSKPDPVPFFAHEATHFYWAQLSRARLERATTPDPQSPGAEAIEALLGKIAEESAGDQFDKSPMIDATDDALARDGYDAAWREYIASYRSEYARVEDEIGRLDAVLSAAFADPGHVQALVDSASRAIPLEGRPVGMYMARAIRRELGDARFAAVMGDPLAYVVAYQEAATRASCRCRALSAATVDLVSRLRR